MCGAIVHAQTSATSARAVVAIAVEVTDAVRALATRRVAQSCRAPNNLAETSQARMAATPFPQSSGPNSLFRTP